MNRRGRSKKSLCEKSMKLVTSIVKVSYISIAKMSLRTGEPPQPQAKKNIRAVVMNPTSPRFPKSLRSQEPIDSSKPVSYLIYPGEGNRSSLSRVEEEKSVDDKAGDYIRKVHEQNLNDVRENPTLSEHLLPPPPHIVLQSSMSY